MTQWTRYFVEGIRRCLYLIFIFATVYSLRYFGELSSYGFVMVGIILLIFRRHINHFLERGTTFCYRHQKILYCLVILWHILLLLSAKLLIRRDASVVFMGAFDYIPDTSISAYLTRNPNNLFLFFYQRFFYQIFGQNTLWLLMSLNSIYLIIYTWLMDKIALRYFNHTIAKYAFSFNFIFILLSPLFLSMYTDVLALPLLALQVGLSLGVLKENSPKLIIKQGLLLGLTTGIVYLIRPTGLIVILALFLFLVLKKEWKKCLIFTLIFGGCFSSICLVSQQFKTHQNQVVINEDPSLAKSPLLFINLGLTHSGTDQDDMKKGLIQYVAKDKRDNYHNGMFARTFILKEINRRLREYTLLTFIDHLYIKLGNTFHQGTLGWTYYEDSQKEKTPFISPLYPHLKDNQLLQTIRHFMISTDTDSYQLNAVIQQVVWSILLVGLCFGSKHRYTQTDNSYFLQLAIFGGILFLMIFEGGKTRYLLQFFPQLIILASTGIQQAQEKTIDN